MPKSTAASIIVLLAIASISIQLNFDHAEQTYVRQIAKNQQVIVDAVNAKLDNKLFESFVVAEFPSQTRDYIGKYPAKK